MIMNIHGLCDKRGIVCKSGQVNSYPIISSSVLSHFSISLYLYPLSFLDVEASFPINVQRHRVADIWAYTIYRKISKMSIAIHQEMPPEKNAHSYMTSMSGVLQSWK